MPMPKKKDGEKFIVCGITLPPALHKLAMKRGKGNLSAGVQKIMTDGIKKPVKK